MVRAAAIYKHREMATLSACTMSTESLPSLWTKNLSVPTVLPFESLPNIHWCIDELPQVTEKRATLYLKRLGGFTKNYRTGLCLCQCTPSKEIQESRLRDSGSRMSSNVTGMVTLQTDKWQNGRNSACAAKPSFLFE